MFPAVIDLIPHRPPFLFVDEILSADATTLTARRTWRKEEDFYMGHYPGAPITPGVLLCESVLQTGALLLALNRGGQAGIGGLPIVAKITDVRFRRPVRPGETTVMTVRQKEQTASFGLMSGSMMCGDARVLNIDFTVTTRDSAIVAGAPAAP
jgi:3-hydroxyacyl-[acyl-carrier-protein] dehydratase